MKNLILTLLFIFVIPLFAQEKDSLSITKDSVYETKDSLSLSKDSVFDNDEETLSQVPQENDSIFTGNEQTIFSGFHGRLKFGAFGGPVFKVGQMNNSTGLLVGGRGGIIINRSFAIGGGGYSLTSNIDIDNSFRQKLNLRLDYGGLELEFIKNSNKAVHYSVQVLIGAGRLGWSTNDFNFININNSNQITYSSDPYFIFEPGINLEFNMTKYFRIGLGVSYRLVASSNYKFELYNDQNESDIKTIRDTDLSGFSGSLTFKFGLFDFIKFHIPDFEM